MKFPQEMMLWLQKDFPKLSTLAPAVEALHDVKSESGEIISLNGSLWQQWMDAYGRDFVARQHIHEVIDQLIKAVQHGNAAVVAALAPLLVAS